MVNYRFLLSVAAVMALASVTACSTQNAAPVAKPVAAAAAPTPVAAPSRTASTANAAGTWKWTVDAGGQAISQTAVLQQDGEKLTGKFTDGFDDTTVDIKEGKIQNGQVSITVVRPFMDNGNITLKFDGKLNGDSITGKFELNMMDQPTTADWNAKRGS